MWLLVFLFFANAVDCAVSKSELMRLASAVPSSITFLSRCEQLSRSLMLAPHLPSLQLLPDSCSELASCALSDNVADVLAALLSRRACPILSFANGTITRSLLASDDLLQLVGGIRAAELTGRVGADVEKAFSSLMRLRDEQQGTWKQHESWLRGSPLMAAHALRGAAAFARIVKTSDALDSRWLRELAWHAESGENGARFFRDAHLGILGTTAFVLESMMDACSVLPLGECDKAVSELFTAATSFFVEFRDRQPLRNNQVLFYLLGLYLVSYNSVHVQVFAHLDRSSILLLNKSDSVHVCLVTAFGTPPALVEHRVQLVHLLGASGKVALLGSEELPRDFSVPGQCFWMNVHKSEPVAGSYMAKVRALARPDDRKVLETSLALSIVTRIHVSDIIVAPTKNCAARVSFRVIDLASERPTLFCEHARIVLDGRAAIVASANASLRSYAADVETTKPSLMMEIVVSDAFVVQGGTKKAIELAVPCSRDSDVPARSSAKVENSWGRDLIWRGSLCILGVIPLFFSSGSILARLCCAAAGLLALLESVLFKKVFALFACVFTFFSKRHQVLDSDCPNPPTTVKERIERRPVTVKTNDRRNTMIGMTF
jgi:hypothetical protein